MSAASMPPPPSPLARRRTRLHPNIDSTSCLPRNMLSKGASFHVASSPYTDADPVLSIPHLARRSPTCSHASLVSLLSEKRDLAAQHIADFEQTFSGARGNRRASRQQSAEDFNLQLKALRTSLPTDEGIGSSIASPASDKGISKSLARVELASNKDSGLGDSVNGSVVELIGVTSEQDGPVATDLVQETDDPDNTAVQTRQSGTHPRTNPSTAIPRSSYLSSNRTAYHPALSRFARKKITQLLIQPILREEKFKDFHSLVNTLALRTHKNIRCLRDLEQSLIFQPLVRCLYPPIRAKSNISNKARNFSVSSSLYRSFGEFTVQLTVDTFQHLSESDQRRATDQPYTSGYFLDLVQQIQQLAVHIGSSSNVAEGEEANSEVPSFDDEVTLEGGLGNTGEIAELVRWRNGKGISLRTGLPYNPVPGIKRQASSMTQDEIERSMARRKKGYIPEIIEMECSDKHCDKVFTRKCDLAKHEKTHSRPYKCPHSGCKYNDVGLPTEKELERHVNDKHDPNPTLYRCQYCEFKTKRESNCKQHMEKKHGWEYKRAKGKDKDSGSTPAQTPHTPAMEYEFTPSVVQPSPAQANYQTFEDSSSVSGSMAGSNHFTPYEEPIGDVDLFNSYSAPLFPRQPANIQPNQFTTNTNFGHDGQTFNSGFDQFNGYASPISTGQNAKMTPATPAFSTITGNSPYMTTNNNFNNQCFGWNEGLPTPNSVAQPYSRHASIQYDSPSNFGMDRTMSNHMMDQSMGDIVTGDFQLFDPAFSNPAGRNETLFPVSDEMLSQKYTAADFEAVPMDLDLEDFDEQPYHQEDQFDDLVNYDN